MSKINNYLQLLSNTSILKTLYINFKCLPLKQAVRLPIFLSKNVHLRDLSGKISISTDKVRPCMISFGIKRVFRDDIHTHTYINIKGNLEFKGHAIFHTGINLYVSKDAILEIGDNFKLGADSVIYARKSIKFGNSVNISWNFQIIDTDFHYIRNTITGETFPNTKPIIIENKCWIGNHVSVSKGTRLPNGTIVSARSLVNKKFETENTIVGGSPAKVLKENFERVFNYEEELEIDAKYTDHKR